MFFSTDIPYSRGDQCDRDHVQEAHKELNETIQAMTTDADGGEKEIHEVILSRCNVVCMFLIRARF